MKKILTDVIGSCSKCSEPCLMPSSLQLNTGIHKLKGPHQALTPKQLRQQITAIVNYFQSEDVWSEVEPKIKTTFDKIEKYFQQLKTKTLSQIKLTKLSGVLKTKDKNILNIVQKTVDGNFAVLMCKDIFQICEIIDNYIPISKEQIKREAQQFCDQFMQAWKAFNKFLEIDIEGIANPQLIKQRAIIAQREQSRVFGRPNFNFNSIQMKSNKKQNQIDKKSFLNIREIDQAGQSLQSFDTVLKVVKVKKRFKTGKNDRIQYTAGDHTGIATVVSNNSPYIEPGKVIQLNDCKIYMFKDKIKQIQPNSKAAVKPSRQEIKGLNLNKNISKYQPDLKVEMTNHQAKIEPRHKRNINKYPDSDQQFSLSQKLNEERTNQLTIHNFQRRKQDQNQQVKTTKIEDIQPGDQGINIVSQVVTIDQIQDGYLFCLLGDSTGVVKAKIPELKFIKEGTPILLINTDAQVQHGHIIIKSNRKTIVRIATIRFHRINLTNNISKLQYQQEDSDE